MKAPLLALIIALAFTVATAQAACVPADPKSTVEVCQESESIQACTDRINNIGVKEDPDTTTSAESATRKLPNILDLVNTGDGSNSAFNDFLPLLRVLLNNGELGDEDQQLGVEFSHTFGQQKKQLQTKLFATVEKPEIYVPIKEAMQAASLTDELSTLEDDISAQDDLTIGASFAFASERTGRDPRTHQAMLQQLIAKSDGGDAKAIEALKALRMFEHANQIKSEDEEEVKKSFCDLVPDDTEAASPDAKRKEYLQLATASILTGRAALRGFAANLRNTGFYELLELINNQPQLSGTANYRTRTEAAGPDEFKLQVSWEGGFTDLNGFKDYQSTADCRDIGDHECLQKYLHPNGEMTSNVNPIRFKFDANYTKIDRLHFVLPAPGFSYLAEATERLAITGTVGMDIGASLAGGKRARFDGALTYEDFSDDPLRQDRGIATLTLTYPLMQGFHLSLGAIYATKPEFRGDVDKEIGARAGITYKLAEDK